MKQLIIISALLLLSLCTSCSKGVMADNNYTKKGCAQFPDYGEVMAFPEAEGFGRYATGGRGGEIVHVTNLNDDGEGSLRDAISKSGRIVVFDVSGIINLKSVLVFSNNLTVAGQTAPGDGVVLYGNRVSFSGADNLICRYLRIRMGTQGTNGKDAAGVAKGNNMIFDHLSVTWGRDENFSINSTTSRDITIQNSIIGQGLQNHSCGGLMQTGIGNGITLFRNLYIDNKTRNPKVKGLNQFVNNVLYNWGDGAAYNMSGDSEGPSLTDIEDNYFVVGPILHNWKNDGTGKIVDTPANPAKPFIGGNELFSTYCLRNVYDSDKDGTLNGVEIKPSENWNDLCSGSPTFLNAVPDVFTKINQQTNATEAYNWIVKNAGASLPVRDQVDAYLIGELTSLGAKGCIIQNERDVNQFPLGGPGEVKTAEKELDSDNDGMPDAFEDKYGLDKNNPNDASKIAANGYTNIENFIFTLDSNSSPVRCIKITK